tara:strand:- start:598 stop:783 length:186 start_codon:yes stop_codon:yes gene_type:complete
MINRKRLFKYLIMLFVIAVSTFYIPNCSIINEHAFYIGLLAATTFALLDNCIPDKVIIDGH